MKKLDFFIFNAHLYISWLGFSFTIYLEDEDEKQIINQFFFDRSTIWHYSEMMINVCNCLLYLQNWEFTYKNRFVLDQVFLDIHKPRNGACLPGYNLTNSNLILLCRLHCYTELFTLSSFYDGTLAYHNRATSHQSIMMKRYITYKFLPTFNVSLAYIKWPLETVGFIFMSFIYG